MFKDYSARWVAARELKPEPKSLTGASSGGHPPAFGDVPVTRISAAEVRAWYATLDPIHKTRRAHAYSLLRRSSIPRSQRNTVQANPSPFAAPARRSEHDESSQATLDELVALVGALPERLRVMPLLAAWCGLRFGEVVDCAAASILDGVDSRSPGAWCASTVRHWARRRCRRGAGRRDSAAPRPRDRRSLGRARPARA